MCTKWNNFLISNSQRGAFVSEPAILVRRVNSGSQVWSMEKLENKLIDMREMYQEYKERMMAGLVSENINFDSIIQKIIFSGVNRKNFSLHLLHKFIS